MWGKVPGAAEAPVVSEPHCNRFKPLSLGALGVRFSVSYVSISYVSKQGVRRPQVPFAFLFAFGLALGRVWPAQLCCLPVRMASRAGKKVWVRDPALADDEVFRRGEVKSDDSTHVCSSQPCRHRWCHSVRSVPTLLPAPRVAGHRHHRRRLDTSMAQR